MDVQTVQYLGGSRSFGLRRGRGGGIGGAAGAQQRGCEAQGAEAKPAQITWLWSRAPWAPVHLLGFKGPLLNNALDGLMLLDVQDLPAETVENLQREFDLG